MSWHGIDGHDAVAEQFRRALERRRLASSFLFVGPAGVGKRAFALKFAQALLCERRPEERLDPCEACPACVQVAAGTHPDLDVVGKPADKSFIPLELLIGDKEHRRREGLCARIGLKPFGGRRKIALIDDADYLNAEGANALLKTLEEPPPRSVLILIGTSPARQLPTIRSRCQLIRFQPLPAEILARLLIEQGVAGSPEEAERLAALGEGSLQRAKQLVQPELGQFRDLLYAELQQGTFNSPRLAQNVARFVEGAGKEASARRQRLHIIVRFATDFYRKRLRTEAAAQQAPDPDRTARRLDCCLETDQQIDRNANQATLIEAWLDTLAAA
ncbi:MAG: DNA polymerase III subunit [Pirellulales bacterium]|nr:DNA polymerase III subunit [Pirellulales bacterium]